MIIWILLPVLLYFFKVELMVLFIFLFLLEIIKGKKLVLKFIQSKDFTTYYDKEGFIRWLPEKQWFSNGLKSILTLQKINLPLFPLIIGYKMFLMAVYYNFTDWKNILCMGLLLTIFVFCGELTGEIIAIKIMINYQKKNR